MNPDISEKRKTKKISIQNNTIQTKQDIPKRPKKFYQHEDIPTTGFKGRKTISE